MNLYSNKEDFLASKKHIAKLSFAAKLTTSDKADEAIKEAKLEIERKSHLSRELSFYRV